MKNLYFCRTPVLSSFGTGRSSAVVVDCGASGTQVTAVHDGYALLKTSQRLGEGGESVTQRVFD